MKKAVNGVLYVVCIVLCVGLFFAVTNLTDNFTTDFKTFYVKVDGKVVAESGSFVLNNNRFEVVDFAKKISGKQPEYTKQVVFSPAAVSPEFIVAGSRKTFDDIADIDSLFDYEDTADGFTMKAVSLKQLLKKAFGTDELIIPKQFDYSLKLFNLVISSGERRIVLEFSIPRSVEDIQLDKTEIVF